MQGNRVKTNVISIGSCGLVVSWSARGGVDLDVDMVVDLDGDGNVEVAGNRDRHRPIQLTC